MMGLVPHKGITRLRAFGVCGLAIGQNLKEFFACFVMDCSHGPEKRRGCVAIFLYQSEPFMAHRGCFDLHLVALRRVLTDSTQVPDAIWPCWGRGSRRQRSMKETICSALFNFDQFSEH